MARDASSIVWPSQDFPQLIHRVVDHAESCSATIIACTSRLYFLETLSSAFFPAPPESNPLYPFPEPNLDLLSKLLDHDLAFCPDVPTLRAYLSDLSSNGPIHSHRTAEAGPSLLLILNPLQLHRHTPSFSAQGLGRTFAAAVAAAIARSQQLVLAECLSPATLRAPPLMGESEDMDVAALTQDPPVEQWEEASRDPAQLEAAPARDPWEESVPILDVVTARRFAGREERLWVGRKVSCRAVAERWLDFKDLEVDPEAG